MAPMTRAGYSRTVSPIHVRRRLAMLHVRHGRDTLRTRPSLPLQGGTDARTGLHSRGSVMRLVLLALSCAAALACGGEPTAPNKSPTSIRLQSDAEDSVGSGKTYDYSLANAVLIVSARTDTFAIHIQGDEEWTGVFTIPNTLPRLEPGFYYRATRFPYNDPARPGLSWFGANGCDSLTGSF